MIRYVNFSPFSRNSVYKLPKKKQYPSSQIINFPEMGKGMAVMSDVFEFVGKCSDKFQKIFKK